MKAIVLAGGHATRLWPITKNRAKPLLPIGKKPIIDYIIEDLDDLDEVLISTNAKFSTDFEDYAEEYGRDNVRVVVEDQDSEADKPGTIGAILKILEQESIDDDLLIIGGDNIYSFDISKFIDYAEERGPANVVYDVKDFELASSFGIVDTDKDRIVGFEEKPEEPPSTLASTACYYFPKDHINLFQEYDKHFQETSIPKEKYLDEPGRLIEWAHNQVDMYAYSFDGHWFDVGTRQGYLEATAEIVEGNQIEGETTGCDLGENVVIMEDAELENVKLRNTIVFPNTNIVDSEIRNSLIDENCEIQDTDLNDAVIGEHTKL
ncbi:nucleotidyltransferase family protein [Candidatus Nanohalobium constans]|uniref:UTP--glucose-1-phosphate urydylyltransferase n=1 Tax=Candidatus Nanohalobium constans TaxID=2565781 RepID=A0A5Q0UGP7_9ARCH|nr:NDP-sugar synthase [Candidatus Nanohalobium constans]QGA80380.1 UTP--glucose-1-phosphate urydylyltransferase [Candidatus Nanohalobium constans]